MKKPLLATLLAMSAAFVHADEGWPVLKTYEGECLRRIKMPLGGIGTGTISLDGSGGLVDWELRSAPGKGLCPTRQSVQAAFVVRTEDADGEVCARLLQGPLDTSLYEGGAGSSAPNHGYPRFRECAFKAAYPLAQVELEDDGMPVKARLEAMNPLVKGDAEKSGMPIAMMRWNIANTTRRPLTVTVAAIIPNPSEGTLTQERIYGGSLLGFVQRGTGDQNAEADSTRGEFALTVPADLGEIAVATDITEPGWNAGLDHFWRRLVASGDVGDIHDGDNRCDFACISVKVTLGAKETKAFPFILSWRFPHRHAWSCAFNYIYPTAFAAENDVGNYYTTVYPTALAAAESFWAAAPSLERDTVAFVDSVMNAKAPDVVKEAALFNLSTIRSETCHRAANGHFFGWEGIFDQAASCCGNCTHVWGYEHALVDIFPSLAKDMLELYFNWAMTAEGAISIRILEPIETKSRDLGVAAADGQMQCIVKAYEYWNRHSDDAWLANIWPNIKKSVEFCWLAGGWDGDQDGVMEGCQHNTMDVDYYGPNPQMEFLYLAALEAAAEMAKAVDDLEFAAKCVELRERGSIWTEANLFNGEYYEHIVRSARGDYHPQTRGSWTALADLDNPDFQLGPGCLVDQLVGDYAARAVGLGPVADPVNARKATDSILRLNRREKEEPCFNSMRDYVLFGERSIRMAWYPEDRKPKTPFPYYPETMTGFEYTVAAWLAETGDFDEAEEVVRDIRDRYDGCKRNPFDEAECGHHYARALAAWTVLRTFDSSVR